MSRKSYHNWQIRIRIRMANFDPYLTAWMYAQ